MINKLILCLFAVIISSCNYFKKEEKKVAIARVLESYLYHDDIEDLVPPGTVKQDSIIIVENYIKNWIEKKLLIAKAELNLSEEKKNIERQIDDYRSSLLIYAFEKELVNQILDTIISDGEIEEYYSKNKQNFELKDYIVKVLYVKLDKNTPQLKKVKDWYKSTNKEDKKKLEEYCHKYAVNFFIDSDVWLYFDDVTKEIPIETFDKESFLKKNKFVELQDENYFYFLNILDYNLKDGISPLSFEKNNIKNIILNARKLELIKQMKKDVYNDAYENKNFEIYAKDTI